MRIAVSVSTWHITTDVQTLCWSKSSPSFSSAHSSCISQSINTIFVPYIGMYIRINMSKTDLIYLKSWCDSVAFCQRGLFLYSPCIFPRSQHSCLSVYIYIYIYWPKVNLYQVVVGQQSVRTLFKSLAQLLNVFFLNGRR